LRSFPEIQDLHDELKFTELINQVKMRHNDVMPTMAMGIQELKEDLGRKVGLNELPEIHQFLDRFYMSRIGIRMLIGQHVALHQQNPAPGFVGLISAGVSPVEVAQNAIEDARSACMRTYGSAPEVHVYGDPNFTFAYIFLPNLIESISFIPSLLSIGLHFCHIRN
jgi:pyruvate dehydrogenase kinase 2/3/4